MKFILISILMLACVGMASAAAPDPVGITNTTGNFWVRHAWGTGDGDSMIAGNGAGTFSGFNRTSAAWQSDSDIVSGLADIGSDAIPDIFYHDDTWYMIAGRAAGTFVGYKWSGTTWQTDSAIVSGLGDIGTHSAPTVFNMSDTLYLIAGEDDGYYAAFNWTGSAWQTDNAIKNGLSGLWEDTPTAFNLSGTWYIIAGWHGGGFIGYKWDGSEWQSDSGIVSGLSTITAGQSTPTTAYKGSILCLISGDGDGTFTGYNWTGSAWQSDSAAVSGLSDVGTSSAPTIFSMVAASTYNVSANDVWHNTTTTTYYNDTYSAHAWQNVTVYAYTDAGGLSSGSVSQDTQIPNNPVMITNTSDWDGYVGDTVYADYDATDADSDTTVFSCSRTDLFTDFSTSAGTGTWDATVGVYYVDFGVSDGYGSTDNYTMTISCRSRTDLNISAYGMVVNYGGDLADMAGHNRSASPPWVPDDGILAGMNTYNNFAPEPRGCAFMMNGSYYILSYGHLFDSVRGHRWTEFGWVRDYTIINGIAGYVANNGAPTVFQRGGDHHVIFGSKYTEYRGLSWNIPLEKWVYNTSLTAGLVSTGMYATPCCFVKGGDYYIIAGEHSGGFNGYKLVGDTWQTDSDIVAGIPADIGGLTSPNVFCYLGDWYLVSHTEDYHMLAGYKWTDDAWQIDSDIVAGLNPTVSNHAYLLVFGTQNIRGVILQDANENIIRGAQVSMYDATENTFLTKWETSHDGIVVPETSSPMIRVSVRTFDGVFTEVFDFSSTYIYEMTIPLHYNVDVYPVDTDDVPITGAFIGLAEYAISDPQSFWGMDLSACGSVPVTGCSGFYLCDVVAEKPGYVDYHGESINWTSCSAMTKEYRHTIVMEEDQ